ncbi:terminase small subunit [Streptomyces racemochromogenes]|uniref:Terminase small subunit n=1 Tax=Streptomyces racemochromogenes TaxID=67353 RepID=A0ABW7PQ80_9ACTN
MRKPTEKQRIFAENYVMGMTKQAAALAAGYAPAHAMVQGAKMMQNAVVKAEIKRLRKEMLAPDEREGVDFDTPVDRKEQEAAARNAMPRDIEGEPYTDSMEFLTDLMNKAGAPLAMRARAAEQLLPYQHARVETKGKKESRKDRAADIAGQGGGDTKTSTRKDGRPKFAPMAAPGKPDLKVVGGR